MWLSICSITANALTNCVVVINPLDIKALTFEWISLTRLFACAFVIFAKLNTSRRSGYSSDKVQTNVCLPHTVTFWLKICWISRNGSANRQTTVI